MSDRFNSLPKKAIKKHYDELISLHKKVIKSYLFQRGVSLKGRRSFFKIYDRKIGYENIETYFFVPTHYFVHFFVLNQLEMLTYKYHHVHRKSK